MGHFYDCSSAAESNGKDMGNTSFKSTRNCWKMKAKARAYIMDVLQCTLWMSYFDAVITEICSQGSYWQLTNIRLDKRKRRRIFIISPDHDISQTLLLKERVCYIVHFHCYVQGGKRLCVHLNEIATILASSCNICNVACNLSVTKD